MHRFDRTIFEYDDLRDGQGITITKGVPFAERERKGIFKDSVRTGGQQALKYSAYYENPRRATYHHFMLGWDHAMVIERVGTDHIVRAIYAHGDSEDNADNCVFRIPVRGQSANLTDATRVSIPAADCGKATDDVWRRYDLSAANVRIEGLVTFSITSCSFACVWTPDRRWLVVSHVAFAPPIPLFWMIKREALAPSGTALRLLASLNTTTDELDKFTPAKLPNAGEFHCTAKYLLRGPYKCRNEGLFAPFKTHPYMQLDFQGDGAIQFKGALGFNNDPDMPVELPPFHSTMGNALHSFQACANANAILTEANRLLSGEFGFLTLHWGMLGDIGLADTDATNAYNNRFFLAKAFVDNRYKSDRVDRLMASITPPVPALVKGKERAAFMLAELTTNPKSPTFKMAFDAVLRAWTKEQLGFEFALDLLHRDDAPAIEVQCKDSFVSGAYAKTTDDVPKKASMLPSTLSKESPF